MVNKRKTKEMLQKAGRQKSCQALLDAIDRLAHEKSRLGIAGAKDEAILMSIGEGLVITDKDGQITFVNKIFENLTGLRSREAIGMPMVEAMPCEDEKGNPMAARDRLVTRVLGGRKAATGTAYYVRKDKSRFPAAITVTPIVFSKKIVGAVEVFRDITREKQLDDAKSEFIYLASHQLRNAPTAINWATESLLSQEIGPINEEQEKYLREIHQRNKNAISLINDLLNVSKIELGKFVIDPEPLEVAKICHGIVDEFGRHIRERKLTVAEDYDKNLPVLQADPQLMQIILQNLISNAIQYTPEGGRIAVKAGTIDKIPGFRSAAPAVLVSVSDTGCGVPFEQRDRIFTRMFRADNAKAVQPNGTGLGLYIAKSILAQVGGKIWFDSFAAKGATFHAAFPAAGMKETSGQVKLTRKPP